VPAGGSAAAAVVAMAAGLVEKSARLSTQHRIGSANIGKRAAVVRKLATLLIDADVVAYTDYMRALRSARGLHTAERERILAPARERIVEVPLAVVRAAAEVVGLGVEMAEHGNPNLRSDAFAAVQLAAAAAGSASVTLADNVRSVADPRLVEARRLAQSARGTAERLRPEIRRSRRPRSRVKRRAAEPAHQDDS
jgi:formiminotetrahydrofolate cyclodeaminase